MIIITLTTILIIFGACCTSEDIDLCSIENNRLWYTKDYSNRPPPNRKFLSYDNAEKPTTFSLYTWLNPTKPQNLTQDESILNNSNFAAGNVTVFLIHGWLGNGHNVMNEILIKAFLKHATINVIVVDWSYWASFNYVSSILAVPNIGVEVGMFIKWLTGFGLSYENVHVVGFSLGGHIAGKAGRHTGSRVRRITALDPAGVLLYLFPHRLVKTDAQYVEVIHTNTKLYGLKEPCGDADFYPNGGGIMPNCWLNMCSHSMSYEYMAQSVEQNNMMAQSCEQLSQVFDDKCAGDTYLMGNNDLLKNISGLFRLNVLSTRRSMTDGANGQLCY